MRKPVHLVFVETRLKGDGVDHNKFYDMFEEGGECVCRYGRQVDGYVFGKTGTEKVYPLSKWESLYSSKISKGYEDKSFLYDEIISTASTDTNYLPIADARIADIVNRLQRYAKETLNANYSVKTRQVTNAMINEVQRILNRMVYVTDVDELNDLLIEIFKTIPRSMDKVDYYLLKDDKEGAKNAVIEREQHLIDVLRGQIDTNANPSDTERTIIKQTILEANGIVMQPVTEEDIILIKKKLGDNAGMFKNAWKVSNIKQEDAYMKYVNEEHISKRNSKLLWHGTRSENVWNILKTGLVLRPTNAVITGKMFGYGLYFAPLARKSIGYTSLQGSYWAKGGASSGFLILHAVAYGTPYDVYSFDRKYYELNYQKLRQMCPGANSLHAHKGNGMLKNDEIVVYNENQVMPLYLVEIG